VEQRTVPVTEESVFWRAVNPDTSLCGCGCGQPTSGEIFWDSRADGQNTDGEKGSWKYPRFVKGHRKNTTAPQTRRPNPPTEGVGSPLFVADVRDRLHVIGKSFPWLQAETRKIKGTGISRTALYGPGKKRPETVALVAMTLGMDTATSMVRAEWPDPSRSPITMRFLTMLGNGQHRGEIADVLGVGYDLVSDAVSGKNPCFRADTIERVAGPLGLSADEIAQELERTKAEHSRAMRVGWERMPTSRQREHIEKLLSGLGPESSRKSAQSRTIGVDFAHLRHLLDAGLSYNKAAKLLGVSVQTVQRRGRGLGIRTKRLNVQRAAAGRTRGSHTVEKSAKSEREIRCWPIFQRYMAQGKNPKARLYWRQIVTESGMTKPTVTKAFKEWLLSTNG
jgi:predicted transcriptional regulator